MIVVAFILFYLFNSCSVIFFFCKRTERKHFKFCEIYTFYSTVFSGQWQWCKHILRSQVVQKYRFRISFGLWSNSLTFMLNYMFSLLFSGLLSWTVPCPSQSSHKAQVLSYPNLHLLINWFCTFSVFHLVYLLIAVILWCAELVQDFI